MPNQLPDQLSVGEIEARLKQEQADADAAKADAKNAQDRLTRANANVDAIKLLLRLVRAYQSGEAMPADLRAY